jgi:hypothetical protein
MGTPLLLPGLWEVLQPETDTLTTNSDIGATFDEVAALSVAVDSRRLLGQQLFEHSRINGFC